MKGFPEYSGAEYKGPSPRLEANRPLSVVFEWQFGVKGEGKSPRLQRLAIGAYRRFYGQHLDF
jgi:hypothetical protein